MIDEKTYQFDGTALLNMDLDVFTSFRVPIYFYVVRTLYLKITEKCEMISQVQNS